MLDQRQHYIDNLRVFAFALLIVYHASVAFFPDMKWLIESPEGSQLLSDIMKHPRGWRLALLFFVSGMGTWFAFRSRSPVTFLRERFVRLLAPLLFAMCVLIVPQVWYERMAEDGYRGSLAAFWLTRYFAEGRYPDGQFTWAHMWFVGYLITMTVVCVPVFVLIESRIARPVMAWFSRIVATPWILAFFLLPLALNLVFTPLYPRQTNALYNDGAWFATWASWFGLGYLVARHHAQALAAIVRLRWTSLAIAALLSVALYLFAWTPVATPIGDYENTTIAFKALLMPFAWTMILALTGFFAVHANQASRFMAWANRGIFPFYIIHQTVIVAALYYILPLDLGVWPSLAAVLAATIAGSVLFYESARRLPLAVRPLFGLQGPPVGPAGAKAASPLRQPA